LISILLVIQIVPYFMTGFESVKQRRGEASPDFRTQSFFSRQFGWRSSSESLLREHVAAVAFVAPLARIDRRKVMTAVAFQRALGPLDR